MTNSEKAEQRLLYATHAADAVMNTFSSEKFSVALIVFRKDEQGLEKLAFSIKSADVNLAIRALKEAAERAENNDVV